MFNSNHKILSIAHADLEEQTVSFQKKPEKIEKRGAPPVAVASKYRWVPVPVNEDKPVNKESTS